jgi:hypothetical protein
VFTLDQTDSNQHVNSLVYIRLFHDAINRRLAAAGQPLLQVRSRAVDIAYRKPCFAGDKVRAQLRLFQHDRGPPCHGAEQSGRPAGVLGAAGVVEGVADGKPRCYVRVELGT